MSPSSPRPPDSLRQIAERNPLRGFALSMLTGQLSDDYLPWDRLRFHKPPAEADRLFKSVRADFPGDDDRAALAPLTVEEWWAVLRAGRDAQARALPTLTMKNGRPFRFVLTDHVLRETDFMASQLSGQIGFSANVPDDATRDRYIRTALEEEAITSSQLEGAATTRRVAKDMLRTGRQPRDLGERMIFNNFAAMQRVRELRDQPLTPDLVREIHQIVTAGTLDDPDDAGRLQEPGEKRVAVVRMRDGEIIHQPPVAEELPTRLTRLCAFANEAGQGPYLPGVLRALTVHFMVSYDHYFVDGNGRTARALFYWSMLHQGYWLAEFLTLSTILRQAPAQYARSFLETEQDDGDLTYFFLYHLKVLRRAIDGLGDYINRTIAEQRDIRQRLDPATGEFNLRQLAVLSDAGKQPQRCFTAQELARRFAITEQTGRNDLDDLARRGLMTRQREGHRYIWQACPDLTTRLAAGATPNPK